MLRNLTVNLMAAFISDREKRHAFRNKYRRLSKFRKLRDDNRRLFDDNQRLFNENIEIKRNLNALRQQLLDVEKTIFLTPRLKPLDNESTPKNPKVYLSVASIARNEGPYIKEWIEYHKIVGVERFYFYDNESSDNTKEVLAPYIKDGTVIYKYVEGDYKIIPTYQDAIYRYQKETRWMAIIDLDEFLVPIEKEDLKDVLQEYELYPALVVNWLNFDSNGHDKKPMAHGGLVTANYTRVCKNHNLETKFHTDRHIKSIVNPNKVITFAVHSGYYYYNDRGVTENFEFFRGTSQTIKHSSKKIRINHYMSKSKEEYINKVNRNKSHLASIVTPHYDDKLNFSGETADDFAIQRFLPKLKKAMGIK